jgi:nucleoside 2-deoxyribosyltransferase
MAETLRAFYASPFAPEFRWVRNAVAKACREHDVELRAVDEVIKPGASIIHAIHQEIDECDFAFAVLTGNNPNVFYELGRLFQASKPTVLIASQDAFATLPFDVRTFAVLGYDSSGRDEVALSTAVGNAVGKVRLALNPRTRKRALQAAAVSRTTHVVVQVDFERIRKDAESMIGKTGCKTVDIQNHDTDSFKGWNQVIECPCGDTVVVIIDLNGDIKRVKVK